KEYAGWNALFKIIVDKASVPSQDGRSSRSLDINSLTPHTVRTDPHASHPRHNFFVSVQKDQPISKFPSKIVDIGLVVNFERDGVSRRHRIFELGSLD